MVSELRYQDMGQQTRCGDATLNRPAGCWGLNDHVATGASLLAPDMADHLECRVDEIELLGYVLSQRLELAAAGGAALFLRLEHPVLARQMRWQLLPRGSRPGHCWRRYGFV